MVRMMRIPSERRNSVMASSGVEAWGQGLCSGGHWPQTAIQAAQDLE